MGDDNQQFPRRTPIRIVQRDARGYFESTDNNKSAVQNATATSLSSGFRKESESESIDTNHSFERERRGSARSRDDNRREYPNRERNRERAGSSSSIDNSRERQRLPSSSRTTDFNGNQSRREVPRDRVSRSRGTGGNFSGNTPLSSSIGNSEDTRAPNLDNSVSDTTRDPWNRHPRVTPPSTHTNDSTFNLSRVEKSLDTVTALSPSSGSRRSDQSSGRTTREPISRRSGNPSSTRSRSRSGTRSNDRDAQGRSMDRVGTDETFEVSEQERLEFEKQKKDLDRQKAARREAETREAEMVARERGRRVQDRDRRSSGTKREFALIANTPIDEQILVPDYLRALITTLRNDDTISPVPEDFLNNDAYRSWRQDMKRTFQEVLMKMIKYRFLEPPDTRPSFEPIKIFFRVVEARYLIGKEGRGRNTFCDIEFGNLTVKSKRDVFRTEVVADSLNPRWEEKMAIDCTNADDEILLQVKDTKDHFLGKVNIRMGELITLCSRSYGGKIQKLYDLSPRDSKYKDKYVGGQIMVSARIEEDKKPRQKSYQDIQITLGDMGVDNRSLFDVLLRCCLLLDLYGARDGRSDVLSPEAVCMLKSWAITWNITVSYQVISYLKIMFEKYTVDVVSIGELLKAFEYMYDIAKRIGSFNVEENRMIIEVLEKMKGNCNNRVIKYKELFPENQPRQALESTILVLRMIHRFGPFKETHPELQASFRDELKILMTEACIAKFQRFKELATPLDEKDVESVIDGINKLADLVNQEIESDVQHFQPAFAQEIDIVRLTAENHLKYFTLILEDGGDILGGDAAVLTASHHVFELYRTLRLMAERYARSVAGLTAMSTSYIEGWFSPFMYKWLQALSTKTIKWVEQAIKADTFVPEGVGAGGIPLHSSSITDVFVAIYSELEFIVDLQWSDPLQNAQFFQAFAKTVNTAIEQYCDAITMIEKKAASSSGVAGLTTALLGKSNEPKDIAMESCAKLRNIAFAISKLREMYRMMNVSAITKTVQNHQKTIKLQSSNADTTEEFISGTFKIHVSYGENLKPTLKSGSSNPYLLVRVPEGTVKPPEEAPPATKKTMSPSSDEPTPPAPQPTILSGSSCEVFRSRVVNETVNPTWDETHTVILPPVDRLEIAVYSKNILTSDEVDGTAIIDLSSGTRLRRKLADYQTHDVYLELEPQGRVLLRLTLEGEKEDVDFWFRRTNERLVRTRDTFLRSLTAKITPYCQQILQKALKDNEAIPLPAKSYFSSLITAVEYSDKTASGQSIYEKIQESDAIVALTPLIEYLEKNLETLCSQLPISMAQAVIEKIWIDVLSITVNNLVPPLFGLHSQKKLSIRQLSMAKMCLGILRDFMHGDGGEFGLPFELLDTKTYVDLIELFRLYHLEVIKLRREYDRYLLVGNDKELLLRLVRLQTTPDTPDAVWLDQQFEKRREKI